MLEFVQHARFTTALPTSMTPAQFVDALYINAGNVLSASERTTAINLFGGAGDTSNTMARSQRLRQVAEDSDLDNAELNRAFVLMQYLGYLRRNPNNPQDTDHSGWEFWLTKNEFNGNFVNVEMVKRSSSQVSIAVGLACPSWFVVIGDWRETESQTAWILASRTGVEPVSPP